MGAGRPTVSSRDSHRPRGQPVDEIQGRFSRAAPWRVERLSAGLPEASRRPTLETSASILDYERARDRDCDRVPSKLGNLAPAMARRVPLCWVMDSVLLLCRGANQGSKSLTISSSHLFCRAANEPRIRSMYRVEIILFGRS